MRPLIGLSMDWDEEKNVHLIGAAYVEAVEEAGGIPLPLPSTEDEEVIDEWLDLVDGLVLTGGVDPDPAHFGEEPIPAMGRIVPSRDRTEIRLARSALRLDLPILAICRGIQVLNVAAGGTLYQDLQSQVPGVIKHYQAAPRWYPTHEIEIPPGTILARILGGTSFRVNSFHHQGLKGLAPGFRMSARSGDGVVEAIEGPGRYVVGVQWHPEAMWKKYPVHLELVTHLVRAAAG